MQKKKEYGGIKYSAWVRNIIIYILFVFTSFIYTEPVLLVFVFTSFFIHGAGTALSDDNGRTRPPCYYGPVVRGT